MVAEVRVLLLVEEVLDSGRTPEDVCRSCPELLPAVLSILERLRQFESEVTDLFPARGSKTPKARD
jgi:eukaryotic-like serine/threonine-protein kinase